jgi:putative two-component system response regulator
MQLAALIEGTGDAVVGLSPAGEVRTWNEGAEGLFGYSAEKMHGRSLLDIATRDYVETIAELLARAASGEHVRGVDIRLRSRDGRELDVRVSASPLLGAGGRLVGVAVLLRDRSEESALEARLSASEQRYLSVVEALAEGVVVQDAEGHVLAFNRSSEQILGMNARELTASSARQPGSLELIHEDGSPFAADEHPTMRSVRTGVPQFGVVQGLRAADGTVRWISINSAPLYRAGERKPYAAVGSFVDITEQRRTLDMLQAARLDGLKRLSLVAEYRDDDTNRHTERVGQAAALTAAALGLDGDFVWTLMQAAPLHDVGKIGVSDRLLLKPGPLSGAEREEMEAHTTIGASILAGSDFAVLRMGGEIALTHHERWDGNGYPAGLRELQIPVAGRIVAVADAFDAMTHRRPYKAAIPVAAALEELRRGSGSQFDPEAVAAFLTLDHRTLVDGGA